jgi:hypothetical protein
MNQTFKMTSITFVVITPIVKELSFTEFKKQIAEDVPEEKHIEVWNALVARAKKGEIVTDSVSGVSEDENPFDELEELIETTIDDVVSEWNEEKETKEWEGEVKGRLRALTAQMNAILSAVDAGAMKPTEGVEAYRKLLPTAR